MSKIQNHDGLNLDDVVICTTESINIDSGEYFALQSEQGKISDKNEIDTLKQRQGINELKNELLGHYNPSNGKYEISSDIKVELRNILKKQDSALGNALFCSSISKFGGLGKFFFIIKTEVTNFIAKSTLYVCEPISRGAGVTENTEIHKVCDFKKQNQTYKNYKNLTFENYFADVYLEFSIVSNEKVQTSKEQDKFLKGIIVKQKLLNKNLNKVAMDTMLDCESSLFLARIEVLSKLGDYGYAVLESYENLKTRSKSILKKDELNSIEQNEILEEALMLNQGKFGQECEKEFYLKQIVAIKPYVEKLEKIKEENTKPILDSIDRRMPKIVEEIRKYDEQEQKREFLRKEVFERQESLRKNTQSQVSKQQNEEANKRNLTLEIKPVVTPELQPNKKLAEQPTQADKLKKFVVPESEKNVEISQKPVVQTAQSLKREKQIIALESDRQKLEEMILKNKLNPNKKNKMEQKLEDMQKKIEVLVVEQSEELRKMQPQLNQAPAATQKQNSETKQNSPEKPKQANSGAGTQKKSSPATIPKVEKFTPPKIASAGKKSSVDEFKDKSDEEEEERMAALGAAVAALMSRNKTQSKKANEAYTPVQSYAPPTPETPPPIVGGTPGSGGDGKSQDDKVFEIATVLLGGTLAVNLVGNNEQTNNPENNLGQTNGRIIK